MKLRHRNWMFTSNPTSRPVDQRSTATVLTSSRKFQWIFSTRNLVLLFAHDGNPSFSHGFTSFFASCWFRKMLDSSPWGKNDLSSSHDMTVWVPPWLDRNPPIYPLKKKIHHLQIIFRFDKKTLNLPKMVRYHPMIRPMDWPFPMGGLWIDRMFLSHGTGISEGDKARAEDARAVEDAKGPGLRDLKKWGKFGSKSLGKIWRFRENVAKS